MSLRPTDDTAGEREAATRPALLVAVSLLFSWNGHSSRTKGKCIYGPTSFVICKMVSCAVRTKVVEKWLVEANEYGENQQTNAVKKVIQRPIGKLNRVTYYIFCSLVRVCRNILIKSNRSCPSRTGVLYRIAFFVWVLFLR